MEVALVLLGVTVDHLHKCHRVPQPAVEAIAVLEIFMNDSPATWPSPRWRLEIKVLDVEHD